MAANLEMSRREDYLKKDFRRNAFMIIVEMFKMSPQHPSVLMDEVLHSIFFLGKINNPPYSPKEIVDDVDALNLLKDHHPRPFECFSSQLPKRSPMSCVLDMVVQVTKQEHEDKIIKKLQELIHQLEQPKSKKHHLVSSTICVSQKDMKIPNSDRYYGVSMSTSGPYPKQILIGASCLSGAWHSYVAGAVMTYYPKDESRFDGTKSYFDGTIKLPEQVRCEAFNLSDGKLKPPCQSCGNLFGLTTNEQSVSAYGNCAEAESVSNLLKKEQEVREQARPRAETCTDENRERARRSVMEGLKDFLKKVKKEKENFKWDENFYTPQGV